MTYPEPDESRVDWDGVRKVAVLFAAIAVFVAAFPWFIMSVNWIVFNIIGPYVDWVGSFFA